MKKIWLLVLLVATIAGSGLYSCTKTAADFNPQGGLLPTNYVFIKDSSFEPQVLTVASGSSITFVNQSGIDHSIVSADSVTILSGTIMPQHSFYFKKDTTGTISYHCGIHAAVTGTIILRP